MSARGPRRAWSLFAGASLALVAAMAVLSAGLLRHERRSLDEAAESERVARLRSAAQAIDRALGAALAREASRHHADYAPYRAARRAFTAELARLPDGSVLEPSPLLGHVSDTFLLHVEWSEEGGTSSPQVPFGRERDLALASGLPPESLREAERRLEDARARIDFAELAAWISSVAPAASPGAAGGIDPASCLGTDELRLGPLGPAFIEDAGEASVGPLVPRLLGDGDLVFARDVRSGDRRAVQVIIADWTALSRRLLAEGASEIAGARLVPGARQEGVALSNLPATLIADPASPPSAAWTPWMTRLSIAWLAGLVALGAIGWSFRASVLDAERRARFAAALSHELRTPLTTLRMYSEMLADGIVTDPSVRDEYLRTIHAESARLASLVENVLLHARVEHSSPPAPRVMTVRALVESVAPVLRRRADEAGRPLAIDLALDGDAAVEVDRDAVERVLFNLVDNACKHGADAEDRALRLDVRGRESHVDLILRDQGPGIPAALGAAVFEAFRRGDENGAPGAGLGLALSRALAREMRGDLCLVPTERGACFRLSLRLAG